MRTWGWLASALLLVGCSAESVSLPTPDASTTAPVTTSPVTTATPLDEMPTTSPVSPASPTITVPDLPDLTDRGIVTGADVSWPQCPAGMGIPQKRSHGAPMPLDSAEFVILGLTNGPGFYPNPCLADQVAWVRERHLLAAAYSVISWPDEQQQARYGGQGPFEATSTLGRLANAGYQQALFNLETMRAAGLDSPAVWLDVEPVPDFDWPADVEQNAAVVRGAARAYADQGLLVGVYSTTSLWQRIVGDLSLGLQEWRAAGHTSREEALARCDQSRSIQGGSALLSQWVEDGRDLNVTCPGASAYLSLWFHQY
ncbi:hypothetical protein [Nocardioides sp.]|uniref:hypothetical protein n=1 Tax=Nocardioides sp. TaxID=35761 RepID=UPI0039E24D52